VTCEEARSALLAGARSSELEAHLAGCSACQALRPGFEQLASTLKQPVLWEEPSPELFDRVVDTVESAVSAPAPGRRLLRTPWMVGAAALLVVLIALVPFLTMDRPQWETTLDATGFAAGATAAVAGWNTETGTRMVITIAGIDRAPADSYYEIWMTAADGRHISAGSFRGPGVVTVWSGATRAEYPRIWITLEPDDGDNNPSGETLFDTA
jgi:hypothetical protein